MARLTSHSITLFAVFVVLASGCGMQEPAVVPDRSLEGAQRQADALVRQARVEAEAIRAEMAATRIAAAKQEAELQELRHELVALRETEARLRGDNAELSRTNAERQQAMEAKEAELRALRAEQERLLQTADGLQRKLGKTGRDAGNAGATRAKLKELESAVALLTVEMAHLKKSLAGMQAVQPSAALPAPAGPPQAASALLLDAGQVLSIRVEPGDTLWELARKYGVSLAGLKAANRLQGDQINAGQRLIIPTVP